MWVRRGQGKNTLPKSMSGYTLNSCRIECLWWTLTEILGSQEQEKNIYALNTPLSPFPHIKTSPKFCAAPTKPFRSLHIQHSVSGWIQSGSTQFRVIKLSLTWVNNIHTRVAVGSSHSAGCVHLNPMVRKSGPWKAFRAHWSHRRIVPVLGCGHHLLPSFIWGGKKCLHGQTCILTDLMRNDGLIALKGIDPCDFQHSTPWGFNITNLYLICTHCPQDDIWVFDKVAAYAPSSALLCQCKQLAVSAHFILVTILYVTTS